MTTPEPVVTELPNGWSLVQSNGWEISVGPDGLIQLPRHLLPSEIDDFTTACEAAAVVGEAVIERNADLRANTPTQSLLSTLVVSNELPSGAVRVTGSSGAASRGQRSRIGRRI